jgi:NAD+ kinase
MGLFYRASTHDSSDECNYGLIGSMSTPSVFPTVAIIGKHGDPPAVEDLLALARFLEGRGHRVVFESATATDLGRVASQSLTPQQIGEQAQLAIVVGGDGTMLGIARQLAPYRVPLIGVNQGRLGFMTDIPSDKMLPVLADMLDGKVESEQRSLLAGTVIRDGQPSFHGLAFNDVVVARGSDGLIVSTPTGSTAYALAAGGPILQPQLGGIVMVPIAPHALSNRPIVLSDDREIEIELSSGRDCSVNFDMQSVITLHVGDRVVLKRSSDVVTFLHPLGWNYFDTLREKLHWNEYPSTSGQLK